MKKILIGILVVIGVVVFGGNYYYSLQVEKQLDKAAQTLKMMGGELLHDGVAITPGGEVRIDDLRIYAPGLLEPIVADRLAVRTGSILGVHNLAMEVRAGRMPEQFGLSFEGLRLALGSENYRQMDMLSAQGSDSLTAAGCGERSHFNARDLIDMGYSEFVVDTHMDFRVIGSGISFEIDAETLMHDMHKTSLHMRLALNASSRDAAALAMAFAAAELQDLSVSYEDRGYAERAIAFCQEKTGLNRQEFIAQHLEAWQEYWKSKGFVAGPNLVSAYEQFLHQPDSFSINMTPTTPLGADALASGSPQLLIYQLRMNLDVNGSDAGRIDLTVMDEAAEAEWRAQRRQRRQDLGLPPEPEPSRERTDAAQTETQSLSQSVRRSVSTAELRRHRNAEVELRLTNGKTLEGRIREIEQDALRLQVYQSGGYVILPVAYADIASAYLK